tara:strand:+ start:714 stop:941 length:228 start_codon:yes stop_codon:yes gene_type:complete
MYIAVIAFTCGSHTFKSGDKVPKDLPFNPDRLKRGLIKEVKVIKPNEIKVVKDELLHSDSDNNKRKPKISAKSKK